MPFITFIYKIDKRTFYGKYVAEFIIDDHEGLDDEIRPAVVEGINAYRKQKGQPPLKDVKIGVLSFSVDAYAPCYSTKKEIECFDFYCEEKNYCKQTIYINGEQVLKTD